MAHIKKYTKKEIVDLLIADEMDGLNDEQLEANYKCMLANGEEGYMNKTNEELINLYVNNIHYMDELIEEAALYKVEIEIQIVD